MRTSWLVPAFTTIMVLLFTWNIDVAGMAALSFLLARVPLLFVISIIYYILVCSLESLRLQGEMEERVRNQEQLIVLQRLQYFNLQKHIEETLQARHDLRQHLNLIQAYLDREDNEALQDYIRLYGQRLPQHSWKVFCSNYAVDTVVRFYAEQAEQDSISFETQIELGPELPVEEPDICILFGNLLENAVEACRLIKEGSPFIRVHARITGHQAISLTVDNSCLHPPCLGKRKDPVLQAHWPGNRNPFCP